MAEREKSENCHDIIVSEEYIDILRKIHASSIEEEAENLNAICHEAVGNDYGIFYLHPPKGKECIDYYSEVSYVDIPLLFGIDKRQPSSNLSTGIVAAMEQKSTDLTGQGVLIGIVDTGINYDHECFIYEDGTSKIVSIWDQNIKGTPPEGFAYGAEYTKEQINEALKSKNPKSIVPSEDTDGHGTFIAGVAAGRPSNIRRFAGMAIDAELVIVKLKPAKKCLKAMYRLEEKANAFQSTDVVQGFKYIMQQAEALKKPVVVLFTGQTNGGPHDGTAFTEIILSDYGVNYGVCAIASSGNEADASHHYSSLLNKDNTRKKVDINVGGEEKGFIVYLWNYVPDRISVEVVSPTGKSTGKVPFITNVLQQEKFTLETAKITVEYVPIDQRSGDQVTYILFENPTQGLWSVMVEGVVVISQKFDMWLPIKAFITQETIFLEPNPYDTVVTPSTNEGTLTVGAYNSIQGSNYIPSGRGLTRDLRIKPDIVATGVNVIGPGGQKNSYITDSGSGIAAGVTAGAVAQLLEWGMVKKNNTTMNTTAVRSYLMRGANRKDNTDYPNRESGFGSLNLYNSIYGAGNPV